MKRAKQVLHSFKVEMRELQRDQLQLYDAVRQISQPPSPPLVPPVWCLPAITGIVCVPVAPGRSTRSTTPSCRRSTATCRSPRATWTGRIWACAPSRR